MTQAEYVKFIEEQREKLRKLTDSIAMDREARKAVDLLEDIAVEVLDLEDAFKGDKRIEQIRHLFDTVFNVIAKMEEDRVI